MQELAPAGRGWRAELTDENAAYILRQSWLSHPEDTRIQTASDRRWRQIRRSIETGSRLPRNFR